MYKAGGRMKKFEQVNAYVKEKRYEDATELLFKIIEEYPDDPIGYVNAGNLLSIMQKWEEAERFFLKAIELDDKTATAFVSLGNLYYEQERYDETEKLLFHAIQLGIEDGDVFYVLGMTHVKRNQLMLALPFLQRAVEMGIGLEETFQYGITLAKLNYLQEAKGVFLNVLEKRENHADCLYNLAVIYVHEGNEIKAKEYLDKVLEIEPNHRLAKQALQKEKPS